ncbi:DUF1090 domain-containing protein [Pragia fontium]|uniref:DUF1090 domain-containing protein n=2 Tax=Pragia fontium TaxID=82985 RepID=A0AAJ5BH42_9GAMM|nr:DUF1090 domain-containing protein [Pragia fontium]AKJ42432.1 hypothetical protein QQ39_10305 [Pragia fontium]SFC78040.1 Protein of unknown function [Pragia fontium DSM 5563 = ATCC 49100]SUB82726.1 Protein of uncharacterised function (DUF1090) [Pragia fontium]VEJ55628.1 Protein of uncharacterised function (DUF1090) [Pragia fontium]GKX61471.1 hypothetical protein SOASR032_00400 [Pragia fontium]
MLKKLCLIVPLIISPTVFAGNAYSGKDYCQIKKEKILQQMEYAKQYNNMNRLAGLERALSNVEAHCTNGNYRANAEQKVADKERKVAKRQAELEKARVSGKAEKIAKKERKLREAEIELDEALGRL